MATSTVEQYIKILYQLENQSGTRVPTQHLADALGVTPGTATVMLKHLAQIGLVDYQARKGGRLSPEGTGMALRLLRYHRLIETFLFQTLDYDWTEIHEEAEVLEHAVSERFIQRIDQLMGHPKVDPHGDPIPTETGEMVQSSTTRLSDIEPDKSCLISRIRNTEPEFLRLLLSHQIIPGTQVQVVQNLPASGTLSLRVKGSDQDFALSQQLAKQILVDDSDFRSDPPG